MPLEKNFDAAEAEPRIYAAWEDAGCFRAGAGKRRDETFTIMLPPPNVTGFLHVGHAFNHTLMDMLTRWKRMQGYDTLWQPGLDHAGIATQLVVEKQMAERGEGKRSDMTRDAFLAKVWEWKATSGGMIEEQARRLGDSLDFSRSAFTMSGAPGAPAGEEGNFHDAVLRVFVDMFEKGYIYRGKRLVNWDPHFETAISDLEVENTEVPGHMWHFKYPLAADPETGKPATYDYVEKDADGTEILRETRDYIAIATTRPETMLGDGAVAVNPADERYAAIVGTLCEIPVGPKEHRRLIPIITDPYPDPAFGSGAVKITGAHDFNDYEVAKRAGIPMYALMDTRGAMRADGRPYADEAADAQAIARGDRTFTEASIAAMNLVPDAYRGLDRFKAREAVVADITAEGLAVMVPESDPRLGRASASSAAPKAGGQDGAPTDSFEEGGTPPELALVPLVEPKPIMQPFGDRSKVVIEPMLTDQWFVDTDKIVGPALEAVKSGRVKIMPESGEKVFYHWLENIEPWCISRQLWWGHQIPVWYGPLINTEVANENAFLDWQNVHPICAANEAEAIAQARIYYGDLDIGTSSASFSPENLSTHRHSAGYITLYRDPDVLDTWFSSGLWPFGTLGWPEQTPELAKYFPGDVLITGQDILFFWVARMMMMAQAVEQKDPFHTVYLHQLVRDAKGEKMSKTRGNVIDPLAMIDRYGADALRMSNAQMAALGGVLKIDEKRIEGTRNFGTKLWNAARFAEMNGAFEAPRTTLADLNPQQPVNRWIIGEVARTREAVDAALAAYRFNDAANTLYAFVWGRVCDWYLELSKPLLMDGTDAEKAETRRTLAWTLDQCLVLLHPIMPFITEELWQQTGQTGQLALAEWPTYGAQIADPDADASIDWTIQMIDAVRSARAQVNVPAGLQVPMIQIDATPEAAAALAANEAMIKRLARIDTITLAEAAPKGAITIAAPGATFALPLADIIDAAAEKARIQKTLDKLGKEIGGLEGRLKNPKFAASAPSEVVAEAQANLALRHEERAKLQTALDSLAEIA